LISSSSILSGKTKTDFVSCCLMTVGVYEPELCGENIGVFGKAG